MSNDQDREDQELKNALEQVRRGQDPSDLEPLYVRPPKPHPKKKKNQNREETD